MVVFDDVDTEDAEEVDEGRSWAIDLKEERNWLHVQNEHRICSRDVTFYAAKVYPALYTHLNIYNYI